MAIRALSSIHPSMLRTPLTLSQALPRRRTPSNRPSTRRSIRCWLAVSNWFRWISASRLTPSRVPRLVIRKASSRHRTIVKSKNGPTSWFPPISSLSRDVGRGRIYFFAMGFSREWSDLPLTNSFLPLLHELTVAAVPQDFGQIHLQRQSVRRRFRRKGEDRRLPYHL